MGQYYKIANLNKKQYLHPHRFDDGLKLLEFAFSSDGTMSALAILLAVGNGQGMGDLRSNHPIIGSWAGDRIAIIGDYADKEGVGITWEDMAEWEDVSLQALEAMRNDEYVDEQFALKFNESRSKYEEHYDSRIMPGEYDAVLRGNQ